MLQFNYWNGPIDAWPLSQNIGGLGPWVPRIDAPGCIVVSVSQCSAVCSLRVRRALITTPL